MTERELLRRHIEAVWELTLPPIDETAHELVLPHDLPPWSLYMGIFAEGQVAVWSPEVSAAQRVLLLQQAHQAEAVWEEALRMRREVVFCAPSITPEQRAQAQQIARVLGAEDTERINAFEAGSAPIFLKPRNAPCIGVVVDGQVVSIAHSSRQTPVACELGVDTLPGARQRGYGAAATTLWTAIVQQQGQVPIYSVFAWNATSLHLAQSVGYVPVIDGVYGPVAEGDG